MYAYNLTAAGLRALTAVAIVLAIGYTFEHGHSMTVIELLRPLLNG